MDKFVDGADVVPRSHGSWRVSKQKDPFRVASFCHCMLTKSSLSSSCITLSCSGPQLVTLYVVRATSAQERSGVLLMVGVSIAAGYAIGCLCSTLITEARQEDPRAPAGTAAALGNSGSIAGWLIAGLAIVEFALVYVYFVEPPPIPLEPEPTVPEPLNTDAQGFAQDRTSALRSSKASHAEVPVDKEIADHYRPLVERQPPKYPWGQLLLVYGMCFIIPAQISGWEILVAFQAESMWGWDASDTGLYLFLILTLAIPVYRIKLNNLMSDRSGVLCFTLTGILGSFMFLGHTQKNDSLGASIFTIGSVVFLISMQIARGFSWALLANLVPQGQRPILVGINAMLYMFGRGVGAMVPPLLPSLEVYVAVFTGTNSFLWLLIAIAYYTDYLPPAWAYAKEDMEAGH